MGCVILHYPIPFPNLGENETGKKGKGKKEKYKIKRRNNHGMISYL